MNDQSQVEVAEPQRSDEQIHGEVAIPRGLLKEKLMAGAQVSAIVPRSFEEVWRIATMAVKAGLVSRDLAQVERAAVAIMHGLELGLPPMMALQRIAVINGRPSVWGDAVPAIAMATNELKEWDERLEGEGDAMTAICKVTRKHGDAVITKEARFSVADAKKADLWDDRARVKRKRRDGSEYETDNDSPWYRYPKRMLAMRARVAFRDLFSDALCGLYIAEELVGRDTDAQMRDVTPTYRHIENPLGGNGEEMPDKIINRDEASEAPTVAVDAPKLAPASSAAAVQKAAPELPSAWDAVFPKPYIRQSPEAYLRYAFVWIAIAPSHDAARARWTAESKIRNGLSDKLDDAQLNQLQVAMGKVKDAGQ